MNISLQKYANISILRILACLGVFTVHLGQALTLTGSLRVVTDFGANGVELFFIISGFLGFLTYNSQKGILSYYRNRAIRIFPLYYFVILVNFIIHTFIYKDVPVDVTGLYWGRYLFFLNGFVHSEEYFWYNLGATWTIPCFVLFYLLMPFFYKYIKNIFRSLIAILLCFLVNSFILTKTHNFEAFSFLIYFILGISIYFAYKEGKELFLICIFSIVDISFIIQNASPIYIYSFLFAILVLSSKKYNINQKHVNILVGSLSKYTYTLYLVQGIVFSYIIDSNTMPQIIILLISILGSALLTLLIYHFIESPIQSWIMNHYTKRHQSQTESK